MDENAQEPNYDNEDDVDQSDIFNDNSIIQEEEPIHNDA